MKARSRKVHEAYVEQGVFWHLHKDDMFTLLVIPIPKAPQDSDPANKIDKVWMPNLANFLKLWKNGAAKGIYFQEQSMKKFDPAT